MTEVRLNFNGLPNFERAIAAGIVAGLDAASQVIAGEMKRGFSRTGRGIASAPGTPPSVQRGGLRNSIAVAKSGALSRRVGTNLPYGRIQEFGGTIRARGGAMVVPIGPAGRRLAESGVRLRSLDLWTLRRPGKAPLLVKIDAAKGSITPLFALVPSVTLPARPWARPALSRSSPRMGAAFNRYAKKRITETVGVRT